MKSILTCAILLAACQPAWAQCCCDRCGCHSHCQKVCRVKCEVQKVPKVEYDCECEEFCVPGPSRRCTVCDECGHKKHIYKPTCGKLRTRTKMIKNTTYEEKVVYKWVVENVCCSCASKSGAATARDEQIAASSRRNADRAVLPASHTTAEEVAEPTDDAQKSHGSPAVESGIRRLIAPLMGRSS